MPGLQNSEANDPRPEQNDAPATPDAAGRSMTPSEAPNNSYETGAGEQNSGFDSPPIGTITLGDKEIEELDRSKPGESSTGEVHGDAEPDVTANHKIPGNEQ